MSYNKLNETDDSELDDLSKRIQKCSQMHSLDEHSLPEHDKVMKDCLKLHGVEDSNILQPFVARMWKEHILQLRSEKNIDSENNKKLVPFFYGS